MKKLLKLNPNTMYVLGFGELLLIALILVVFVGAKRIPEIAKGLGGGIKSFKNEFKEPDDRDLQLPPEDRDAPRD
jgi:sec-independent protein translocase protein TatA